jgi:hypothetical protein
MNNQILISLEKKTTFVNFLFLLSVFLFVNWEKDEPYSELGNSFGALWEITSYDKFF